MRSFALVLAAVLLSGCAPATRRVATDTNAIYYWHDRYVEQCVTPTPVCVEFRAQYETTKKDAQAAFDALNRGGNAPLHLKRLRRNVKKLGKVGLKP